MSLNLDTRQRAMLREMGVGAWLLEPSTVPAIPEAPAQLQDPAGARPVSAAPAARRSATDSMPHEPLHASGLSGLPTGQAPATPPVMARPTLAQGQAPTSWSALGEAVASCQACVMCQGRKAPVMAPLQSPPRADWMVLGEPPDDEQERAGRPFAGEAGDLLDKMLGAVGAKRLNDSCRTDDPASLAYLSLVLKCRPAVPATPDDLAVQACASHLQQEIALVQPKVILAMGRLAMRLLLSEAQPEGLRLPLAKLRGRVWLYQGVPVVVTYPPAYLLRNAHEKAKAWEDLKLARAVVAAPAS